MFPGRQTASGRNRNRASYTSGADVRFGRHPVGQPFLDPPRPRKIPPAFFRTQVLVSVLQTSGSGEIRDSAVNEMAGGGGDFLEESEEGINTPNPRGDPPAYSDNNKVPEVLDDNLIDPIYQTIYVNSTELPSFSTPNLYGTCLPEVSTFFSSIFKQ